MEDVETFMLLQGELYLKVVPLDWIIFSVILGNLTDEDNKIYMLSIPSSHGEVPIMIFQITTGETPNLFLVYDVKSC